MGLEWWSRPGEQAGACSALGGWLWLLVMLVRAGLHQQSWCLHILQALLLSPLTEKFLQNQRLSYGQVLSLLLGVEGSRVEMEVSLLQVQLVLEGEEMEITMSSRESQPQDSKLAVTFRYLSQCFGDPWLGLGSNILPGLLSAVGFSPAPCSSPGFSCVPTTLPGSCSGSWAVLQHRTVKLALSFLPRSFFNRLQEAEEGVEPSFSAFSFQRLLSNLTSLRLRVSCGPVPGGCLHTSMPWGPSWAGAGASKAASRS